MASFCIAQIIKQFVKLHENKKQIELRLVKS